MLSGTFGICLSEDNVSAPDGADDAAAAVLTGPPTAADSTPASAPPLSLFSMINNIFKIYLLQKAYLKKKLNRD